MNVIVIGAGANGLACGCELAKSGHKVTVLERRAQAGGLSARRAFGGFEVPGVRHDTSEIRPSLVESLGLSSRGVTMLSDHVPIFASEAQGKGLLLHFDSARAKEEIAARSKKDADAYTALRGLLSRLRPMLEALTDKGAPPLLPRGFGETIEMGLMGLKLRGLGRTDMIEFLRAAPMCVADWMREQFETEVLSATIAMPAVLGDFVGPWSPGTAAMLVLRDAVAVPGVKGGPAAVVDALLATLAHHGGTLRTEANVTRIRVEAGRATGVTLASGESLDADAVIAACNPKQALVDLLPPLTLSVRDHGAARTIRTRGTVSKVHLGLRDYPSWKGRPKDRFERVRVGEHLDDLERAFDAAKYRELPARPVLDIACPTANDEKADKHVLSIHVSGTPYDLSRGWDDAAKSALLESVLAVLADHAPKIRELVVASEVLSPVDLEREYGATGGSIHHVERALDQMVLMRPARPFARGTTPVDGLFLGSSGCHPGPGVTLAPGVLAARTALGK